MTALTAAQAYRLWAPLYRGDNAVCALEEQLVSSCSPSPRGRRLLDVGCGTGLRLRNCGAALAIGVDASAEMLAEANLRTVTAADARALPFAQGTFDLIWCRLMMGYLPDLKPAYAEMARVCQSQGQIIVSDFHADATRAGHRQTFRDAEGNLHEITHYAHDIQVHKQAAAAAGLSLTSARTGRVGRAIRAFYEKAGRLDMYARDEGLPIVALYQFEQDHDRVRARSAG